jgi:hypothetical protein
VHNIDRLPVNVLLTLQRVHAGSASLDLRDLLTEEAQQKGLITVGNWTGRDLRLRVNWGTAARRAGRKSDDWNQGRWLSHRPEQPPSTASAGHRQQGRMTAWTVGTRRCPQIRSANCTCCGHVLYEHWLSGRSQGTPGVPQVNIFLLFRFRPPRV